MFITLKHIFKVGHKRLSWLAGLWVVWLCAISVGYLIYGGSAVHPVDARNAEQLTYMHLEYPLVNSLTEPLTALWKIMNHAADIHVAMISYLCWGIFIASIFAWKRSKNVYITCKTALMVACIIIFYDVFMLMMSPSGWRLVLDEPGLLVADLHSHSYYSHDSFLDPVDNLKIHRDAGFNVVAITDHINSDGARVKSRLKYNDTTTVLQGIETHDAQGAYLIAVGAEHIEPLEHPLLNDIDTREWIRRIHEKDNGIVIAMYINLHPEDIARLRALGVDAFEISNRGHPDLSRSMRIALNQANKVGVPLVASSDLHGWGIDMDTWTVFRSSATGLSPEYSVLSAIRDHRHEDIIPVSSHSLGEMTIVNAITAPFRNILQYSRELSLSGLISWWAWSVILLITGLMIESISKSPRRVVFVITLFACGSVLLFRGFEVLLLPDISIDSVSFKNETGLFVCAVGVLSLVACIFMRETRRYSSTLSEADKIMPHASSLGGASERDI